MDLRLEVEFSKTELTANIDSLKNQIDQSRPLSQEIEDKVMQKLRLEWNYHSNAIEGNRLNYGETVSLLMYGITAKGKPLKDHLDIQGHNEAINFLFDLVKDSDERNITESDIRALHEKILVKPYDSPAQTADGKPTKKWITLGEYKSSPNHVKTVTGETHFYASPEETPAKMQELMDWYKEANQNKEIHPLILAALFHYKFVAIHPFDDGNGRLSRILMNLILMRNGFPPVVIKMEDRQVYYSNLSLADNRNYFPFIEFIGDYLATSLNLYLKAIGGGDIDEPEDIDKDIALFKLELQNKKPVKENILNARKRIITSEIEPILKRIILKTSMFEELFSASSYSIIFMENLYFEHNLFSYKTETLNDVVNFLDEESSKFFTFKITFKEFKTVDLNINFNVFENIFIYLNEDNFGFADDRLNYFFKKNNDEKVSISEQFEVVKHIVNNIKNSIQENF